MRKIALIIIFISTLNADSFLLGQEAGKMLAKVLLQGKPSKEDSIFISAGASAYSNDGGGGLL